VKKKCLVEVFVAITIIICTISVETSLFLTIRLVRLKGVAQSLMARLFVKGILKGVLLKGVTFLMRLGVFAESTMSRPIRPRTTEERAERNIMRRTRTP